MFQLGKTIVSEDLIEKDFVCNLNACKGDCCVHGDAGAPLEKKETEILKEIYPNIKPFLRKEGIRAIEQQGTHITKETGELETPLVEGEECAYVVFDDKGIAMCGIEQAYLQKKTEWQKPISCHLYPVRVKEYSSFSALNYHKWHVCDAACSLGKELQIPIYKFVKDALIRKFGADWYRDLEAVAKKLRA
ncbi:MAG: DUF3109 family protein [Flavobacteriaceae bacterium]|nr:DUF3109 family protein [Flavobacteriaceae bacterium]